MFHSAIVRVPSANVATGLTNVDMGAPDYDRAIEQHKEYCEVLRRCGLTLTRLKPDERYPDSTFVEDTAVLTKRCAILARPGAATRRGEVEGIAHMLIKSCPELHSIRAPGTLDGGDVCQAGTHFFIGISRRTNESGAQQLAELLESFGYTSCLMNIRNQESILHLKSGVASLGDDRLVVIEKLMDVEAFRDYELVRVNAGEEYAANCVRINNHVLIAAGFPAFDERLKDLGYNTIQLDMSEFQKLDGGLSCLSLRF